MWNSIYKRNYELSSDETVQSLLKKGRHDIWKNNDVASKYPLLWEKAKLYAIAFPPSYPVEARFSHATQFLT